MAQIPTNTRDHVVQTALARRSTGACMSRAQVVEYLGKTVRLLVEIDRVLSVARIRRLGQTTRGEVQVVAEDEEMAAVAWEALVAHAEADQRLSNRPSLLEEDARRVTFPWGAAGTAVRVVVRS